MLFVSIFYIPWVSFLLAIIASIYIKRIIIRYVVSMFLVFSGLYTFFFILATTVKLTVISFLLVGVFSVAIGIYLSTTTYLASIMIKSKGYSGKSKRYLAVFCCCIILYILSYVVISRLGMQRFEKIGMESNQYYFTKHEYNDSWKITHYTLGLFYYPIISLDYILGTGHFKLEEPATF